MELIYSEPMWLGAPLANQPFLTRYRNDPQIGMKNAKDSFIYIKANTNPKYFTFVVKPKT